MSTCGYSGLTRVLDHDAPATLSWLRTASADEVALLHHMGELPPGEESATLPVFACDEHGVACGVWAYDEDGVTVVGTEIAAATHDTECRAPGPTDGCSVCHP